MTSHTPGPWKSEGTCVYALNGDGSNIFFCGVQGGYKVQNRNKNVRTNCVELLANARLIAAAPELLAVALHSATALRLSGVEANAHSDNPIEWLLHQTEAAIAKAKGEL